MDNRFLNEKIVKIVVLSILILSGVSLIGSNLTMEVSITNSYK